MGWSGWLGHCLLLVLASKWLVWVVGHCLLLMLASKRLVWVVWSLSVTSVSIRRVGLGGLVIVSIKRIGIDGVLDGLVIVC